MIFASAPRRLGDDGAAASSAPGPLTYQPKTPAQHVASARYVERVTVSTQSEALGRATSLHGVICSNGLMTFAAPSSDEARGPTPTPTTPSTPRRHRAGTMPKTRRFVDPHNLQQLRGLESPGPAYDVRGQRPTPRSAAGAKFGPPRPESDGVGTTSVAGRAASGGSVDPSSAASVASNAIGSSPRGNLVQTPQGLIGEVDVASDVGPGMLGPQPWDRLSGPKATFAARGSQPRPPPHRQAVPDWADANPGPALLPTDPGPSFRFFEAPPSRQLRDVGPGPGQYSLPYSPVTRSHNVRARTGSSVPRSTSSRVAHRRHFAAVVPAVAQGPGDSQLTLVKYTAAVSRALLARDLLTRFQGASPTPSGRPGPPAPTPAELPALTSQQEAALLLLQSLARQIRAARRVRRLRLRQQRRVAFDRSVQKKEEAQAQQQKQQEEETEGGEDKATPTMATEQPTAHSASTPSGGVSRS